MTSVTPSVCSGPLSRCPRDEDTLSREERSLLLASSAKVCHFHLLLNRLQIKVARKEIQKGGVGKKPKQTKENKTS